MDAGWVLLFLAVVAGAALLVWVLWRGAWPRGPGDALLRQILGEEEFRQLVRRGYLDVPSPAIAGRIYRVPYSLGRVDVIERGVATARLCLVTTCWIPPADMVLTHKLLIEGDEPRYLRVANHFPARGVGRTEWWSA